MTNSPTPKQGRPWRAGATSAAPFLDLYGGGQLPAFLQRLLPDPCKSLEQWHRYTHQDIASMSATDRNAERWRLRVALAEVESTIDVVPWVLERLDRLAA